MHSRCFGIMRGHGNLVFNLTVKLFGELGYRLCVSTFEVINSGNAYCIVVSLVTEIKQYVQR
jgi:hypothetical protein